MMGIAFTYGCKAKSLVSASIGIVGVGLAVMVVPEAKVLFPALIAGLPVRSACVADSPPLFARGASIGFVPLGKSDAM